jgi:hypothetical protein
MLCALLVAMGSSCSMSTTGIGDSDSTALQTDSTVTNGDSSAASAGPAAQVSKLAGDRQVVPPGTAVPIPPAVRVTDRNGHAVSGAHVVVSVSAGGGSVAGGDAITDSSGKAGVGSWTLGPTKGTNLLTASAGEGLVVSFTATAADSAHEITQRIIEPGTNDLAGDTLQVAVTVTSLYELASVRASVDTTQVELTVVCGRGVRSMRAALVRG